MPIVAMIAFSRNSDEQNAIEQAGGDRETQNQWSNAKGEKSRKCA